MQHCLEPNPVIIETGYHPESFQREIHEHLRRFSVLVCHRRFGKTVVAINALIDAAVRGTPKRNGNFMYLGPYKNQAEEIAWALLKLYTARIPGIKVSETEVSISFSNGSRIKVRGADRPDTFRGEGFDGVVLDEVADMRPTVWTTVIRPALTDRNGWALFIGTPKGINLFYDLYLRSQTDPLWYSGFYPWSKTCGKIPWLSQSEIDDLKRDMTEDEYLQEYECDFSAAVSNALITLPLVNDAMVRVHRDDAYNWAPRILGVDVARYGKDQSVIFPRQGLQAFRPERYKGLDNVQLAHAVIQYNNNFHADAICIDAGRGEGVIDYMRALGYSNVFEINFGSASSRPVYLNKRVEMWNDARKWLQDGGSLPDDNRLRLDLTTPQYRYTTSNKQQLESKEEIHERCGFSPDSGDAFALTFGVSPEIVHNGMRGQVSQGFRGRVKTAYE